MKVVLRQDTFLEAAEGDPLEIIDEWHHSSNNHHSKQEWYYRKSDWLKGRLVAFLLYQSHRHAKEWRCESPLLPRNKALNLLAEFDRAR